MMSLSSLAFLALALVIHVLCFVNDCAVKAFRCVIVIEYHTRSIDKDFNIYNIPSTVGSSEYKQTFVNVYPVHTAMFFYTSIKL